MAAGVLRVVFVYDLVSRVLLTFSLSVLCSIVAILTRVAGWILLTACFGHFLLAVRPGTQAVTKVVLLASGFSPLGVDAFLFFTRCVSPGTLYTITAGFTVTNMTWVGNSVLSAALTLGAFLPPHRSMGIAFLEEDSVTDFAVLPNSQEDEAILRGPLKILSALFRQRGASHG